jgi:hypothetical protein
MVSPIQGRNQHRVQGGFGFAGRRDKPVCALHVFKVI